MEVKWQQGRKVAELRKLLTTNIWHIEARTQTVYGPVFAWRYTLSALKVMIHISLISCCKTQLHRRAFIQHSFSFSVLNLLIGLICLSPPRVFWKFLFVVACAVLSLTYILSFFNFFPGEGQAPPDPTPAITRSQAVARIAGRTASQQTLVPN